jgi:hypothetical protein
MMSYDFIPPVVEVLKDQQVTFAEIQWLTMELLSVIMAAVLMTTFWELAEEGVEW